MKSRACRCGSPSRSAGPSTEAAGTVGALQGVHHLTGTPFGGPGTEVAVELVGGRVASRCGGIPFVMCPGWPADRVDERGPVLVIAHGYDAPVVLARAPVDPPRAALGASIAEGVHRSRIQALLEHEL